MDLMRSVWKGDRAAGAGDAATVLDDLLVVIDGVREPCVAARGLRWGLVRSGLLEALGVRAVVGSSAHPKWEVELILGTTSPACLMYLYFEREIRARLTSDDRINDIRIEWHHGAASIDEVGRRLNFDQLQLREVGGWFRYSLLK